VASLSKHYERKGVITKKKADKVKVVFEGKDDAPHVLPCSAVFSLESVLLGSPSAPTSAAAAQGAAAPAAALQPSTSSSSSPTPSSTNAEPPTPQAVPATTGGSSPPAAPAPPPPAGSRARGAPPPAPPPPPAAGGGGGGGGGGGRRAELASLPQFKLKAAAKAAGVPPLPIGVPARTKDETIELILQLEGKA
jgi:hypothetical protein